MKKLIVALIFFSCGLTVFAQNLSTAEYIEKYKNFAIREMYRSGIPASITLAQGILESGSGNSDLALSSNNHFGIKCKADWSGPSVRKDDDKPDECFRAYNSVYDSYRDHSDFLVNSPRYSFLFDIDPQNYSAWAKGLKKAGYATDPAYANRLISSIEKYNLNQYTITGLINSGITSDNTHVARVIYQDTPVEKIDVESDKKDVVFFSPDQSATTSENGNYQPEVIPEPAAFSFTKINNLKSVWVPAGTSLLSVAARYKVRLSKLLEWNELDRDGILKQSQHIFLEKKRNEGNTKYVVINRATGVYDLSQQYGILSESLCMFNRVNKFEVLPAGTTVYLQATGREAFSNGNTGAGRTGMIAHLPQ